LGVYFGTSAERLTLHAVQTRFSSSRKDGAFMAPEIEICGPEWVVFLGKYLEASKQSLAFYGLVESGKPDRSI
jgi:hypothetical protein